MAMDLTGVEHIWSHTRGQTQAEAEKRVKKGTP
jgi:hypothetical protein